MVEYFPQIPIIFGYLFYIASACICGYAALHTRMDTSTNRLGRYIFYYGWFNIFFWCAVTILLVVVRIGRSLL